MYLFKEKRMKFRQSLKSLLDKIQNKSSSFKQYTLTQGRKKWTAWMKY